MSAPELSGQRFGLLTVLRRDGSKPYGGKAYLCRCDCGTEKTVAADSLRRGITRSCGCAGVRGLVARSTKDGLYYHPLRRTYDGMKERCYRRTHVYFAYYGGRGIIVCDRWLKGEGGKTGFECFLADMGPRPPGHEIDRRDNDGNYEPGNCRWIPQERQAINRRNTVQLTFRGETKPLVTWAKDLGMSVHALRNRYYDGWTHDQILTTPVGP
jgi:hypothetical protein